MKTFEHVALKVQEILYELGRILLLTVCLLMALVALIEVVDLVGWFE